MKQLTAVTLAISIAATSGIALLSGLVVGAPSNATPAEVTAQVETTRVTPLYSKEELRKRLTPIQYQVTQEDATERPFRNEYWNNKEDGIYVDIVSGEPLFSSLDKYKSGTGWPSFSRPLVSANIVEKEDNTFFMKRTEVRSKNADSHLGHVFDDGPLPTGLRYCMNSAAMRFVPVDKLQEEGYGEFLSLFQKDR